MLITDIRALFPNFYQQLYQLQSPHSHKHSAKSKHSQESLSKKPSCPDIDYECKRKFCSFCIRTNYDENIHDLNKNKNWHCYHCTGYCMCTRCSRQDITTQLKAYLISLGGNLNILRDQSASVFDQLILKNFNETLELTLGQNQDLYLKYPYYLYLIQNKDFVDPTQVDGNSEVAMRQFSPPKLGLMTPSPIKYERKPTLMPARGNLHQSSQQSAE